MSGENSGEQKFEVDCTRLKDSISLEDIKGLNKIVVAPEEYREELGLEQDKVKIFADMLKASNKTDNYSTGHENDEYYFGNPGPITSLLDTELSIKCRRNNDPIYLSAVLMHRITEGHCFEEGNKRTAFLAASIFIARWQAINIGEGSLAIPKLEENLLEALRSIADNDNTDTQDLVSIYGEELSSRIKEINSS